MQSVGVLDGVVWLVHVAQDLVQGEKGESHVFLHFRVGGQVR